VHYLLFYDAVENYEERRKPFREAHIKYARAAASRGELVLGGAVGNPADGAVILFHSDSPATAEQFATSDPYVLNGVIRNWRVREWTTVVGADAQVKLSF
jgi:uncharacterized protein YciI